MAQRKAHLAQTHGVEAGEWVNQLKAIANADVRKLFDDKGSLLPVHLWPEDAAEAVESLDIVETPLPGGLTRKTKKVRLHNKLQAIMRLVDIGLGVHGKPQTQANVQVLRDHARKWLFMGKIGVFSSVRSSRSRDLNSSFHESKMGKLRYGAEDLPKD